MGCQIRPGDPHDKAHVRDKPVIGAEDRGAQRVATHSTVPALQTGQGGTAKRPRRTRGERLDDAGMRALGRRQPAGDRFRLSVISAAVEMLERIDGRQHKRRAEAPREPSERTRSEEHTSELQSPCNLVCRLLLEKKKKKK